MMYKSYCSYWITGTWNGVSVEMYFLVHPELRSLLGNVSRQGSPSDRHQAERFTYKTFNYVVHRGANYWCLKVWIWVREEVGSNLFRVINYSGWVFPCLSLVPPAACQYSVSNKRRPPPSKPLPHSVMILFFPCHWTLYKLCRWNSVANYVVVGELGGLRWDGKMYVYGTVWNST